MEASAPETNTTLRLRGMSTAGEVPAFFKSMGSDSPARPRQKFCGVFCPVEGSSDSKTLDFDALSACRGRSNDRVIDRQTDISQPRKVEIRESTGKEALQNLDDKRVIFPQYFCTFFPALSPRTSPAPNRAFLSLTGIADCSMSARATCDIHRRCFPNLRRV